jgi:hypothetical protein
MATRNPPAGGNRRGRVNKNKSESRNQHRGIISTARDNPVATAAAVGGAVAAGVFLWSRRNQISDQIGNVAEQIGDWRDGSATEGGIGPAEPNMGENFAPESPSGNGARSQTEIAEEALTLKEIGAAV